MRLHSRALRWLPLLAALTLTATACLGGAEGGGAADDGEGGGSGTLTMMSAFSGDEAEKFEESFAPFVEETGIDINYEPVTGFETVIVSRVQGGNPPDIAFFPQPGLLMDISEQTDAVPLEEFLEIDAVEEAILPGFLDAARNEQGQAMGLPMKATFKSVLWTPVPAFEEAGYEIPETHEDLEALEDQIIADGGTPWCLGMESGDATGWVGTDWVEEYMLRLHGPDVYDQWVNHELPFDSPEVQEAFEKFGERWEKEGNVQGGTQGVLSIAADASTHGLFQDPPACFLHRQGDFATGFFPPEVGEDLDANVQASYFPAIGEGGFDGNPVLAGGDLALMINDTPEARQFMEFLTQDDFGQPWAEQGGWLSPNVNFDNSVYPDEVTRSIAEIGQGADVVRFDASDLMPGAVGTGSFWTGIVDWVSGQSDLESILASIQQSWPATGQGGEEETEAGATE